MDLSIPAEDTAAAAAFDRFCQEKIAPRAHAVDHTGVIPPESWRELADMGFFKVHHAEADGGLTVPWVVRAMMQESLAKACAATFLSTGASIGLCGAPLARFGTAAQKQRWLKPIIDGDKVGCFALTEPGAGTDAASIQCQARKVAGGWVLGGDKALITNAPVADVAVVFAVTDKDAGVGGVTMFVVDLSLRGVSRSRPYKKMGLRGSATGGLTFDDVRLSDDDVVGEVGQGFLQAMQTLELGRVGMCHFALGIADAAYEASKRYAMERRAFGKPIGRLQAVHFKIADMKVEIDGARLMARQVAWRLAQGEDLGVLPSVAKTYATEMAVRVTDMAVQIHGGWGYTDDFVVERLFRDARLGPIGEGTSEIQRELIARALLDG
ncbi:MAG: acyl-CoA dehydrogenase [Deltaproteobacteria bacterium]|nr:acyl-CoA dehydrogenase [Deltaproteobacteria bacterium]